MLKRIYFILILVMVILSINTLIKIGKTPIIKETINYKNKIKVGIKNQIFIEKPIGRIIINKIDINSSLYDINSKKNNVDENITILKESIMPDKNNSIVYIAAHSGNDNVSFFNELDKLSLNDEVILEYQDINYTYFVNNIYEIKKEGYIYGSRSNKKQLILTTCCPKKPDCQLIINCIEKTDN